LEEQQQWQPRCCCSSNLKTIFSQKKKTGKMLLIEIVIRGEFFRVNNTFQLDSPKSKKIRRQKKKIAKFALLLLPLIVCFALATLDCSL
jgi:hypothetical protein